MSDDINTELRCSIAAELTGIPAATLAGLRENKLVAVPREPTQEMAMAGGMGIRLANALPPHEQARGAWLQILAAAQDRTP